MRRVTIHGEKCIYWRVIEINGEQKTLSQWAEQAGVKKETLRKRLILWGVSLVAIDTPLVRNKNLYKKLNPEKNKKKWIASWCLISCGSPRKFVLFYPLSIKAFARQNKEFLHHHLSSV